MTQDVIHGLEVVEVEEENGDSAFALIIERVVQMDPERRSVRKIGQRIVERLVGELRLQRLALADVTRVQHETPDRGQVEQVGDGDLGRAVGVIFTPEPAFEGER